MVLSSAVQSANCPPSLGGLSFLEVLQGSFHFSGSSRQFNAIDMCLVHRSTFHSVSIVSRQGQHNHIILSDQNVGMLVLTNSSYN